MWSWCPLSPSFLRHAKAVSFSWRTPTSLTVEAQGWWRLRGSKAWMILAHPGVSSHPGWFQLVPPSSRLSALLTSCGSPKTWGDGFPLNVSPAPPVAWGWISKPNPLLHLVVYYTPVTLFPQSNVGSLNLQVWYKATFTGWLVLSHDLAYQPETKHWLIWSMSQLE